MTSSGSGRTLAPGDPARSSTATPTGRTRRPSGEPPPLPRVVSRSTRGLVVALAVAVGLSVLLAVRPIRHAITSADLAILQVVEDLRIGPVTSAAEAAQHLGSPWVARVVAWGALAVLLATRRFQHLVAYLLVVLAVTAAVQADAVALGRMRPVEIEVLGDWSGYAHPSAPIAGFAVILTAALCALVPAGSWRRRGAAAVAVLIAALAASRLYLGVDHPSDVFAALAIGVALPVVGFRIALPDDVAPVSYRRGRRAHLDVGGRRGDAIVRALRAQLDLEVTSVEPFALAGSSGSTPLRLRVRDADGRERFVFAKLYAWSHLRSDRLYKLVRTVLYGRLEDELPFNSVRRLVGYEDHMLRLLRDSGVPTAAPLGVVEITPEREYLLVTEFLEGATELSAMEIDDRVVDAALDVVERLWLAGLAHRDLKPSNVLVRDGDVLLVDVAFGEARPSPWRQAVDLANMMLTLALCSTAEHVYERALLRFTPDDVAEAFAASRGITIPTQLRDRLRDDGRDLHDRFRELAPARQPVAIQRWTVRRAATTLVLVAGALVAIGLVSLNLRLAGLL